ncbi:Crp/Fnr family transcriptional regulator [Paraflavisolibacter sp. H34]|uniref:Crp/Fnr family transcriptional regulator n=1 Tax=Huijunlia imazamoxiresistens TaxID=3127457 RepID=UPI00301961AB
MKLALSFHQYLNQFVSLTDEEFENHILPHISIRRFRKKDVITRAGEVENFLNFIAIGLVREYYICKGMQVNTQISSEGQLVNVLESFYSRTPSESFLEALEPSTLISITFDDLEKVFVQSQKMERLGRRIITSSLTLKERRQLLISRLDPRERFIRFVSRHPDLIQRVPQKHLASFLNIQPETFSRFKHLLRAKSTEQDIG